MSFKYKYENDIINFLSVICTFIIFFINLFRIISHIINLVLFKLNFSLHN